MNKKGAYHNFPSTLRPLMERGLYLKIYDPKDTFQEQVPAEYYLVAFGGKIECPMQPLEDRVQRKYRLLEHVFSICSTSPC